MLWGLSPALDLLSEYEKVNTLFGKKTINILLIGSTDGRHILRTMSALRRHSVDDCDINFFIMDLATELIARQLLFFTIALEPEDHLGIQEKSRLWMEIYGNTLLRPVTAKYLISKAVQLIHMVTNKDYQNKRLPLVDLDFVKYKEIDYLENIFKYWIRNRYSIAKIWDNKLRKSLGTRYDSREGVFDWDYNMKLHQIEGGNRVCASEYKLWRKVGSSDPRHILKTMAHLKRHSKEMKVNFYVSDSGEVIVRQMLLLTVALEPGDKLGLLEKSRCWMEIYGNTLLRSSTAKYAVHKICQLRHMISDKDFLKKRMPLIDLDLLRYTDLDYLEEVAKYYQNNKRYTINRVWDELLRVKLEDNYDYRFKFFDFDYGTEVFMTPGGHRVCKSEYIHWRNTGIAFTWLETEYSVGNPTLAVGIGSSGDDLYSHGYWGDMESGPYFAFGTDSEEKPMLEVRNDVNVRRATDITERNLQRMFYELEHGSPPTDLYTASIDLGLVMMKPGNVDVEKEVVLDYEPDRTPEDYSAIPVPNCKVYFLPGNALEIFPKKAKNKEFFDIAFVAQNFFKFINEEIMSMMRPNGCLIVETRKFVVGLQKDAGSFGKEVRSKLGEFGWEEVTKCHFRKDSHALFRKGSGKPSSEKNIQNASEDENDDLNAEIVTHHNTQIDLEDTDDLKASTLKEFEKCSSLCTGNENSAELEENEIVSSSSGINSVTSQEDTKADLSENFRKTMEEDLISGMDGLTISGGQSDEDCPENTKDIESQVQKSEPGNKDLEK